MSYHHGGRIMCPVYIVPWVCMESVRIYGSQIAEMCLDVIINLVQIHFLGVVEKFGEI